MESLRFPSVFQFQIAETLNSPAGLVIIYHAVEAIELVRLDAWASLTGITHESDDTVRNGRCLVLKEAGMVIPRARTDGVLNALAQVGNYDKSLDLTPSNL